MIQWNQRHLRPLRSIRNVIVQAENECLFIILITLQKHVHRYPLASEFPVHFQGDPLQPFPTPSSFHEPPSHRSHLKQSPQKYGRKGDGGEVDCEWWWTTKLSFISRDNYDNYDNYDNHDKDIRIDRSSVRQVGLAMSYPHLKLLAVALPLSSVAYTNFLQSALYYEINQMTTRPTRWMNDLPDERERSLPMGKWYWGQYTSGICELGNKMQWLVVLYEGMIVFTTSPFCSSTRSLCLTIKERKAVTL